MSRLEGTVQAKLVTATLSLPVLVLQSMKSTRNTKSCMMDRIFVSQGQREWLCSWRTLHSERDEERIEVFR